MNPLALCALLGLACAAPPKHKHYEVMGMVAGHAREVMEADWDRYNRDPSTPERMYEVTKDSVDAWQVGESDTLIVLFVLDVAPVEPKWSDPVSFHPLHAPPGPGIHTHGGYCNVTHWGLDFQTCSNDRPEANQCRPSFTDMRTQIAEGHVWDVIQCGRSSWIFYFNPQAQEDIT